MRWSREALAMAGASTTCCSGSRSGWILGSSSKTSSPAPAIQPSLSARASALVHAGSAGRIHDYRGLPHQAERALTDEVAGLGREVRVERHEVGLAQERLKVGRGRGELPLDGSVGPHGVVVEDAHVEAEGAPG